MGTRGVAVGLAVVGVLAAGGIVADGLARTSAEQRFATAIEAQIAGLDSTPDVVIDGFPFVTQLLAGELADVRVAAPSATVDGLRLEQVEVHLTGVSTDGPTVAEQAHLTARAPLASIRAALPVEVDLTVEGDLVIGSTEVLGMPLDVLLRPVAAGRAVQVDVEGFRLAGAAIDADQLPGPVVAQLRDLAFPIDALPAGVELTALTLEPTGIVLTAEGTAISLAAP